VQRTAKETIMQTYFRHAAVALALLAGTGAASAQTYIIPDAVGPTFIEPLQLTPAQRTTIYRTIIPQRRGRAPIVRERIVTEPVAPTVRERIVTRPIDDYAYDYYAYDYRSDYAYAPRADGYYDYAYVVGSRVPPTVRLEPLPPALVAEVPVVRPYRYMRYFDRVLLIDPVTSTVVADVSGY
jgi:hypothetical protein